MRDCAPRGRSGKRYGTPCGKIVRPTRAILVFVHGAGSRVKQLLAVSGPQGVLGGGGVLLVAVGLLFYGASTP